MKKKILGALLLISLLFPLTKVNAAGLGISASTKSTNPGNEVYIKVSANGLAGKFQVSSSNSNVLSGGGTDWIENDSKTYTFKAKTTGTATITVTPINVAYSDGSGKYTGSKSITINIVKPREKSTNNNLKSLEIEGATLTPEFNKDTLEYTAEITNDAEKIKINAEKEDGYASLEGDGEIEVAEGANKLEVKVTSETGVEKVYTLNVTVKDANPIKQTTTDGNYTLVKRAKTLTVPEGLDSEKFTQGTFKINDTEIPTLENEELKLKLVGLKDENGNIYLYKVEDEKITTRYEVITSKGLTIEFKEPKKVIEGYTKKDITIDGKGYTAYQQDKYKNYALIYGTNLETNEDGWYLYNIKEKSIQTYAKDIIDDINNKYDKQISDYKMVIALLTGLSGLLLLILIIVLLTKKKRKPKKEKQPKIKEEIIDKKEIEKELEDTKEIDKLEIIVNKVEEPKEETKKKDKKGKKNKEIEVSHEENKSEFLNTEDLKEILNNPKIEEAKDEDEMDTTFFDDYHHRKKKKR